MTTQSLRTTLFFEGAFFGNLFSNNSVKYSCQGEPESEALDQSPDRKWRVCTDSENLCQMNVLGACSNFCSNFTAEGGYTSCTVGGQMYGEVVNVFLRDSAMSYFLSLSILVCATALHLFS